jgi:hypothetical protein
VIGADLIDALSPVVAVLEKLGVRYRIGGSIASSLYGVARATLDIDLVVDLAAKDIQPFTEALSKDYYVEQSMVADAVRRRASFNVIHLGTMIKVDVFVLKTRSYDQQAFLRAQVDTLDDAANADQFYFAAPEDVVLNKLEWFRLGYEIADRQWRDVLGVLKVQQDKLDYAYLHHWARKIGVLNLLDRAIVEAKGA